MERKGTPADFHTIWAQDHYTADAQERFDKEVKVWLAKGYHPVGGVALIETQWKDWSSRRIIFSLGMLKPAIPPTINLFDTEDLQPGAPTQNGSR